MKKDGMKEEICFAFCIGGLGLRIVSLFLLVFGHLRVAYQRQSHLPFKYSSRLLKSQRRREHILF